MITVAKLEVYGKSKKAFYRARDGLFDRSGIVSEGMQRHQI